LAEDGVIAIHVSNRHLDLIPVVRDLAFHNGLIWSIARDNKTRSDWVIVGNERVLKDMVDGVGKQYRFSSLKTSRNVVKWTDDYSNIFKVLKF
jgi:urease accessory protein UreE